MYMFKTGRPGDAVLLKVAEKLGEKRKEHRGWAEGSFDRQGTYGVRMRADPAAGAEHEALRNG